MQSRSYQQFPMISSVLDSLMVAGQWVAFLDVTSRSASDLQRRRMTKNNNAATPRWNVTGKPSWIQPIRNDLLRAAWQRLWFDRRFWFLIVIFMDFYGSKILIIATLTVRNQSHEHLAG